MSRRVAMVVAGIAVIAGLVLNFDSLLLHLGDHLPGTEDQAALSLISVWWPAYKTSVPDGLVVHSYIGAPHLRNHLRDMPVLQSALFALPRPVAAVHPVGRRGARGG